MSTTPIPLPQEANVAAPPDTDLKSGDQGSPDFSNISGHFHVSEHIAGVKRAFDELVQHARDARSTLAGKLNEAVIKHVPNFDLLPKELQNDVRTVVGQGVGFYSGGLLAPGAPKVQEDFEHPLTSTVPPVGGGPKELVEGEGLVYKGELAKGSGVHMVEHPNHPGKTAAVDEPITAEKVHAAVNRKLDEFGADPNVPETARQFLERRRGPVKDFSSVEGHVEQVPAEEKFRQENQILELRNAQNKQALKRIIKEDRARREVVFEKAQPKPVPSEAAAPVGSEPAGESFYDKTPVYEGPTGQPHDFSSVQAKQVKPAKVKQVATPPTVREGYYNTIEHVVQNKLGEKFTPEQLQATLKNAGVPKQELESLSNRWFGNPDLHPGETVTKQEVLDHLDRNRLRLDIVTKGGEVPAAMKELINERANLVVARDIANRRIAASELRHAKVSAGEEDPGTFAYTFEGPSYRADQEAIENADKRLAEIDKDLSAEERWPGYLGGGESKYENYTLPGGTNYREVLLQEQPNKTIGPLGPHEERARRVEGLDYYSPHFDEPNIMAHLRLKDRVDAQGQKSLFMEEVQSDWAHDASPEGREGPEGPTVPQFPLGASWHELALKHALKEAVDGGYDSLSWTTGQQQAERYNLAKTVDHLVYVKNTGALLGYKNGSNVFTHGEVSPENLSDYIGKDLAKKMLESPSGMDKSWRREAHARGNQIFEVKLDKDQTFGGESHKHLYDEMIPQFLNKYTKRWGGKVGTTEVGTDWAVSGSDVTLHHKPDPELTKGHETKQNMVTVHTLPITPELREAVKAGQPMFGMGVSRGEPKVVEPSVKKPGAEGSVGGKIVTMPKNTKIGDNIYQDIVSIGINKEFSDEDIADRVSKSWGISKAEALSKVHHAFEVSTADLERLMTGKAAIGEPEKVETKPKLEVIKGGKPPEPSK